MLGLNVGPACVQFQVMRPSHPLANGNLNLELKTGMEIVVFPCCFTLACGVQMNITS